MGRLYLLFCVIMMCVLVGPPVAYGNGGVPSPKYEFRSVWIATALALDYPKSTGASAQEAELRSIIRHAKDMGMNAIIFQVVARGDAMYPSERLPWSPWLAGPGIDPGWDPLAVAIEETHALGMEFHAWYNVYRIGDASTPVNPHAQPLHVRYAHPEWIEEVGNDFWLNPAYPDGRQWLIENVMEIVENYNIDAIHFDFIRYNQTGYLSDPTLKDQFPNAYADLNDWRRENINMFVREVYEAIKNVKPWVKVGSTPIGHYKPTTQINWPALWGYSSVFQDSRRWLQEEVHDYLNPQLYWAIGQTTDTPKFEVLVHDWMSESYGRHVYIGQGPYKANVLAELPQQIDTTRVAGAHGQVQFRYLSISGVDNPFGNRYRYRALVPPMDWLDIPPPVAVHDFRFERVGDSGVAGLQWSRGGSNDPESIDRFAIYRFNNPAVGLGDLDNPSHIYDVTGSDVNFPKPDPDRGAYFVVTSLNRNSQESAMSSVVEVPFPATPVLVAPFNESDSEGNSVDLTWSYADYASFYVLEVYEDEHLTPESRMLAIDYHQDTTFVLADLEGETTYYWRLRAANAAGISPYSEVWQFTTGFPRVPVLVYPAHNMIEVPLDVTFTWEENPIADSYRFQLSNSLTFADANIVADIQNITEPSVTVEGLNPLQFYFWRVRASNEYGTSTWSSVNRFRTQQVTFVAEGDGLPTHFDMRQNYPNPFNPSTVIEFQIPEARHVNLTVYDILGRKVDVLLNQEMVPGYYQVTFDGSNLPSGMYIYRLSAGSYTNTKRMILAK